MKKRKFIQQDKSIFIQEPKDKIKSNTIVTIGASTGGPRALQQVITKLPREFLSPILIVQHMPKGFTKSLADRLNGLSNILVKEAEDGEMIKKQTIYIAPGDMHMRVRSNHSGLFISLSQEEPRNNHRPSVNILFESVAKLTNINKVAVILTGMGNDGSEGVKHIKEGNKNATVIAESEETSIVFGMPKAAIRTTIVDYIDPLQEIAGRLVFLEQKYNKDHK